MSLLRPVICPLRSVVSFEEEWRTSGNRRFPRGRACLWIKLSCGHFVQRMVRLNRDKTVTVSKRARCDECPVVIGSAD